MPTFKEFLKEQKWSGDVKTKYHTPEGLFTKSASEIVSGLMKDAKDATQALHRLMFYMNRAGEEVSNKPELEKAKKELEGKIEK